MTTMTVRNAAMTRMTNMLTSWSNVPRRFASRAWPAARRQPKPPTSSEPLPTPEASAPSHASQSVARRLSNIWSYADTDKRPAMFRKGYWTAEKRQQLKVMGISFPFMIASAAVLYNKYTNDGDAALISDEEKLARAYEQAYKSSLPHSSTTSTSTTTQSP